MKFLRARTTDAQKRLAVTRHQLATAVALLLGALALIASSFGVGGSTGGNRPTLTEEGLVSLTGLAVAWAEVRNSSTLNSWRRHNPDELAKLDAYVAEIVAGGAPREPVLTTIFGDGMADLFAAMIGTPPPPPPTTIPTTTAATTTTATTTTTPTTTAATTTTATIPVSHSMPQFAPPAFTPKRTIIVTTPTQFAVAWAGLQPGDYLDVRGVTFAGETVLINKVLSSPAEIHFDSGVHFTGAAGGSKLPAVWVSGDTNIRFFGGDVTGAGNDGIRFDDNINVLWWDFNVHDTAGTGVMVRGITKTTSGLDLRGTISRAGYDLLLDPHAEKGTGLHGINIGTGTGQLVTNSRFVLYVHDQAAGAAVEVQGVQNSKLYLDARRITFKALQQTAGNAIQIWGSSTVGLDVPYLLADALAGQAVNVGDGLDSSNGNITIGYARATNVAKTPEYAPSPAIIYGDVS